MAYGNNDYRDYIEHSARGQKWSSHKYLYITPNGRYVYPEDQTARRVENSFRPLTNKYSNRPQRGRQKTYGTVTAPDGSNIVKKVAVAKKQKIGIGSKLGNSNVFNGYKEEKKRPSSRQKTYGLAYGPDGAVTGLKRGVVGKKKRLNSSNKVGSSNLFKGKNVENYKKSLDLVWTHKRNDLKIGGKPVPKTRPKGRRKKYVTSGHAKIEYWT